MCHTQTPPILNVYGEQLKTVLLPDKARPLSHDDFTAGLKEAMQKIADLDADGDGVSNIQEIKEGYLPADKNNTPSSGPVACDPSQGTCGYDPVHAYKKVSQDFCGQMLTYEKLQSFRQSDDKRTQIKELLATCLDSKFWMGKNGALWSLAHKKIRPAKYAKSGEDGGAFPVSDYYEDYHLFAYSQTDNHDARLVLTAQFYVDRKEEGEKTIYTTRENPLPPDENQLGGQAFGTVPKEKRAGMATTPWTVTMITMFSVIPRGTAAQMYRSYLGLDIAKRQGLYPVRNEPADYDNKSVRAEGCRDCHQTLDAMSYPFTRYNGLSYEAGQLNTYNPRRMELLSRIEGPRLKLVPEAGFILGKKVKDLVEWAKVAANSDAFAKATVMDYWQLLFNATPSVPKEREAFATLWKDFKDKYQYSVERMLHALVQMEVYGAP